jgi:hypothetical protein
VSDRGETVYVARCPALKIESAIVIAVDGRVDGVVHHSR